MAAVVFVLLACGNSIHAQSHQPVQQPSEEKGWSALRGKVGWIVLGVRLPNGKWDTAPSFTALTGGSDIPKPDDEIVLSGKQQLLIVGFMPDRSEARANERPAKNGVVTPHDITDVTLKTGMKVRVQEVAFGIVKDLADAQVVWARVTPSRDDLH
jgi:hypothetical protein